MNQRIFEPRHDHSFNVTSDFKMKFEIECQFSVRLTHSYSEYFQIKIGFFFVYSIWQLSILYM
jgi:hypothetical protein